MTTISAPTGTGWPSSTTQPLMTPSAGDSTSTVALSVSISASTSPFLTGSPSFFTLRTSVPSAISKPSLGMGTISGMVISGHAAGQARRDVYSRYMTFLTALITSATCGMASFSSSPL